MNEETNKLVDVCDNMKKIIIICFMIFISKVSPVMVDSDEQTVEEVDVTDSDQQDLMKLKPSDCWMTLNTDEHFKTMDSIDERYAKIRQDIQASVVDNRLDESMIDGFIYNKGIATREVFKKNHKMWLIPAGINLGGYCMLKMPNSVLFFHRMKLRNNTVFRIDHLENNLADMLLNVHLTLNDLYLRGVYERSLTENDPSILIYAPTFGEVEFVLEHVRYRMEGRYRMISNRLVVELIVSEIYIGNIMMTYLTKAVENKPMRVDKSNLGEFVSKLKTDLDKWLKDYFNDFMIYARLDGLQQLDQLEEYDKAKGTALEEYTDHTIENIKTKLRKISASSIRTPEFTFKSVNGMQIKLYDGIIHGLDSMYRRSVATGVKRNGIRHVDTVVGFSNLKVVYNYEAILPTGVPPLTGVMTLSANELSAHLALAMVSEPESIDIDIELLGQLKPESLTVEGAANLMISNFRHLLEHQIIGIMSNTLFHGVNMLKTLPRCKPFLPGVIPKPPTETDNTLADSESYELFNDTEIEQMAAIVAEDDEYKDDPEVKIALRSTKLPHKRRNKNQSNKSKVLRKKLRKLNQKKLSLSKKTSQKKPAGKEN